jgi:hypothetical protein
MGINLRRDNNAGWEYRSQESGVRWLLASDSCILTPTFAQLSRFTLLPFK